MIEVKNIYCGYDNKEIIKNLSFKVNNGENLCIVGPNGCGKSTLLKSIANIIEYRGNVKIDDKEVNNFSRVDLAKKVALMSQMSQVYFPYTVYDTVSLGRYAYSKGAFSKLSKQDREIVEDSMKKVGVYELKDKLSSQATVAAAPVADDNNDEVEEEEEEEDEEVSAAAGLGALFG